MTLLLSAFFIAHGFVHLAVWLSPRPDPAKAGALKSVYFNRWLLVGVALDLLVLAMAGYEWPLALPGA